MTQVPEQARRGVLEADVREHKADFTGIYTAPDPRAYFRSLARLDYQMPLSGLPVLRAALAASGSCDSQRTVLDLCCSYGQAAAMMSSPDGPGHVTARYLDPAIDALTPEELARADARYYAAGPRSVRVAGLDSSRPALSYALRAGLLSDGWCEDLERYEPSAALAAGLREVGVIFCTGGVGYVGRQTFERLLLNVPDPGRLWLVIFVLRVFDYTPIASLLAGHGLVTERLPQTFPQRRFANADEQEAALRDVRRRGLDPAGRESAGWFHADCFVSRPARGGLSRT